MGKKTTNSLRTRKNTKKIRMKMEKERNQRRMHLLCQILHLWMNSNLRTIDIG
jgi:hypothetical protein